jgi:hypothetical protein
MANKMSFSDMMSWANENSKSDFKNIFIKFSEGVHVGRILNVGHDPEYDNDIDRFFRSFRVHDMGQKSTFWSGLCLDYVMDNKQGIRKYLIQTKKLNKAEGEKIKTNGCVACVALEALEKEYGLDRKELNNILRSKTRIIAPFFYLRQALPEPLDDKGKVKEGVVPSGLYVWEMSPSGLKKILQSLERFVKLEIGDDEIEEEELLKYFELETGLNIAVGAEGEGVGKNSREYTFEFKGKQGPLQYRNMPYGKDKTELLTFDPSSYGVHELHKIEAEKFLTYQQMANKMLFLGDGKLTELGKIIQQVGYEIPGFEASDNPLDDNYSQSFADKVLGEAKKKTLGINPVKNVHAEKARAKQKQKEEEEERWDDDETPPTRKNKAKVTGKTLSTEEDDNEEEETPKSKSKQGTSRPVRDIPPIQSSKAGKNKVVDEEEEEIEEDDYETIDEEEEGLIEEIEEIEEDEELEEEDEEEEEETPAQKRKKAADAKFRKAVPPSDSEDEEEEEEEVRPKKKQQKKFY